MSITSGIATVHGGHGAQDSAGGHGRRPSGWGGASESTRQPSPGPQAAAGTKRRAGGRRARRGQESHTAEGAVGAPAPPARVRAGLAAGDRGVAARPRRGGARPRHAQCAVRSGGARPAGRGPACAARTREPPRGQGRGCSHVPAVARLAAWSRGGRGGAGRGQGCAGAVAAQGTAQPACVPRTREPHRGGGRRCTAARAGLAARGRCARTAGQGRGLRRRTGAAPGTAQPGPPAGAPPKRAAEPHRGGDFWCTCVGAGTRDLPHGVAARARLGLSAAARHAMCRAEHGRPLLRWSARPARRAAGGTSGSSVPGAH